MKTYTMLNKPTFRYGEQIQVDMAHLGWENGGTLSGKIVGKGSVHVIDMWLVEFEKDFGALYPYRVFTVPHVAILDPT